MALTPGLYRPQADSQRPLLFINDFQTQHEAQPDKAGQWEARLWGGVVGRATWGAEKTLEKKPRGQDVCSTRKNAFVSAELRGLSCVSLAPH